jgi:hypothetical protein
MNRIIAAVAALALSPAALAEDAQPPAASTEAPSASAQAPDVAAIEGKVDSLAEQYAETKTDVAGLKKLKLSGYVQSRWRWKEDANYSAAYGAGATDAQKDALKETGFHIRRGRFKAVYSADFSQLVLQLDATPSGVSIKEGYAAVVLPYKMAVDVGLQLLPFGYEVASRSSSDLDTLERAEMTRRFLAGEYDLGAAVRGKVRMLDWKVGLFNGNGIEGTKKALGTTDNDQLKDLIGRVTGNFGMVTAGLSGWWGKGINYAVLDASGEHPRFDRQRFGADVQVYLDLLPIGGTAVKGEYIWGRTWLSDKNNGAGDMLDKTSSGWYALVTQNVGRWNQLAVRYERFIPDHGLDRDAAGNQSKAFEDAELQAALHTFLGSGLKLSVAWFHPMVADHGSSATGTAVDPKKDSVIAQLQAKF